MFLNTRRDLLRQSFALSMLARYASAEEAGQVIPFAGGRPFDPKKPLMQWDELTSWLTPEKQLFWVAHYGIPKPTGGEWRLGISGMVANPKDLTLDSLKARPRRELTATLECSGNGPAGGLIGNVTWTGTPLASLLKDCGVKPGAVEAVFFAADQGTEKIRGGEYPQQFARSLPVSDAMKNNVLLAYELNGAPLSVEHGAPVRLVVPGWYGVAWVKWLNRIELHDRRFESRFMGRDYVTIRGEQRDGQTIWRETSVGRMNLKSVVARVVRRPDGVLRVTGAAWSDGTPVRSVQLRIDNGEWMPVEIGKNKQDNPHSWKFWSYEWKDAKPGEHTLASRATDANGKVQPAPDDPFIALKKTYWEANQFAVRKITI
ncbi:MAG: sulfite oxidase [Acidobacteria bacterium]|nr:sulfite oxidase [Acidobacteriota bacterium]